MNPLALALEVGIDFLNDDFQALERSMDFISGRDNEDLAGILVPLKIVAERLPAVSHSMKVIQERILFTANGGKETAFRDTYSSYVGSSRRSKMNENQRRALFIANVVLHAIEKYKFEKYIQSTRSYISDRRQEEMERLISNAIYTALGAEDSYNDSAGSRLFVDKYVELSPKWAKPPELVGL